MGVNVGGYACVTVNMRVCNSLCVCNKMTMF